MRKYLCPKFSYILLTVLTLLFGCEQRSPEIAGHQVGVNLGDFLDQPDRYIGYHIVVVGLLEVDGDNLRVTNFDADLHDDVSSSQKLYVYDSTPGQWISKEGLEVEPQCTRRRVAVSGEIGEITSLQLIGIKEIDTIFLVKDDPSSSLDALCYSAELPEFYVPKTLKE